MAVAIVVAPCGYDLPRAAAEADPVPDRVFQAARLAINFRDPDVHLIVVARGGIGGTKGGYHVKYQDDTPLANLLLTLLERGGVPLEFLGNSTGDIASV